jgi:hypothetical protein
LRIGMLRFQSGEWSKIVGGLLPGEGQPSLFHRTGGKAMPNQGQVPIGCQTVLYSTKFASIWRL